MYPITTIATNEDEQKEQTYSIALVVVLHRGLYWPRQKNEAKLNDWNSTLFRRRYFNNHIGKTSSRVATVPLYIVVHPGETSSETIMDTFGGRVCDGASVAGGNAQRADNKDCRGVFTKIGSGGRIS